MFSQVSVILSTIGLMDTRSLLILVTARSVRILLECFLVGILATQTAQNIIHRSPATFQNFRTKIQEQQLRCLYEPPTNRIADFVPRTNLKVSDFSVSVITWWQRLDRTKTRETILI